MLKSNVNKQNNYNALSILGQVLSYENMIRKHKRKIWVVLFGSVNRITRDWFLDLAINTKDVPGVDTPKCWYKSSFAAREPWMISFKQKWEIMPASNRTLEIIRGVCY